MSFVAAELRRRERAQIAEQHRTFVAQAKQIGVSDTVHNFAKWLEQQREAEQADGWKAIR